MILPLFLLTITVVVLLIVEVGILVWVEKLFKIENPTYKTAFKTLVFSVLTSAFSLTILYSINLGFLSNLTISLVSFFGFHYFLKRYHHISWKKSLGVYVVYGIIGSIISLVIVVPFRYFVVEPYAVSGTAMSPTYNTGDYLLVNKFDKSLERGDKVVFNYPNFEGRFVVERIIGLPTERVDIQDGKVLINGQVLNENYTSDETLPDSSFILNQDQYFVLGDNRLNSTDSRIWGPIHKSTIKGKVFYKVSGLIK